jgi:osmotically-inducible protein OsmY
MKTRALGHALTLLTAAACAHSQEAPAHVGVRSTGAVSPAVDDRAVSDPQILRVLLGELDRDAIAGRERIRVRVDLGIVTLSGSVTCRLAKDRVAETAHLVRGVRAVMDGLSLAPQRHSDGELGLVADRVLSRDPVTAAHHLETREHDGVVWLWGDVDSMATRRIAEADVLAIPGVREVSNNLGVRPQRIADWRLASEVERTMNSDPWLVASRVRTEMRENAVFLSGFVGSAAERTRAEYDARSAAPAMVDVSMLGIDTLADDGTLRAMPGWAPSDSDIRQTVLDVYAIDSRTSSFLPTVVVQHQVVLLTGAAPDLFALRAAEDDARSVQGALAVQNDMRERGTVATESDNIVLAEVVSALARDARLAKLRISVDVHGGRVHLHGTVPTSADRMNAVALASSVEGALDVQDALVVAPTGLAL